MLFRRRSTKTFDDDDEEEITAQSEITQEVAPYQIQDDIDLGASNSLNIDFDCPKCERKKSLMPLTIFKSILGKKS